MCRGIYATVLSPIAGQASANTRGPRGSAAPMISQQVSRFAAFIRCASRMFSLSVFALFIFSQQEKPQLKNNRAECNKQVTQSYVPVVSLLESQDFDILHSYCGLVTAAQKGLFRIEQTVSGFLHVFF